MQPAHYEDLGSRSHNYVCFRDLQEVEFMPELLSCFVLGCLCFFLPYF